MSMRKEFKSCVAALVLSGGVTGADVVPFFREHYPDAVPLMPTLREDFERCEPLEATESSNQATVIVALGGRYRFTEVYHGHLGLSYNASPTDASDDDGAFRDIDLWSIGLGASRNGENVSTVLGLRYSFGDDDEIAVEDLVTGETATVSLDVSLLTLSFSTAYRF